MTRRLICPHCGDVLDLHGKGPTEFAECAACEDGHWHAPRRRYLTWNIAACAVLIATIVTLFNMGKL